MLLDYLVTLPRSQKRLLSVTIDTIFIFTAFWFAFILRLDSFEEFKDSQNWSLLIVIIPLSIFSFIKLGLYRAVLRYINSQALWAILLVNLLNKQIAVSVENKEISL